MVIVELQLFLFVFLIFMNYLVSGNASGLILYYNMNIKCEREYHKMLLFLTLITNLAANKCTPRKFGLVAKYTNG